MKSYGLLGEHLGHSMSPKIHNLIFGYTDLKGEYNLFPMPKEDVPNLIDKIKSGEIKGINVTIPYKLEVMKYLDVISEEAQYIGAVNTICMKNGKLTGYNTDCFGFEDTLIINGVEVKNKNVAVLGTGGASKAVVYVLNKLGAQQVDLFSRSPKGNQLGYDKLGEYHNYQVIVNTTPVGMYPKMDCSPISEQIIGNAEAIVDLIYNPIETKLLTYAKDKGIKYVNGMYMLVGQAVKAQEIFNSKKIDNSVTKKIYDEMTGGK